MPKRDLKRRIYDVTGGVCALSGEQLPEEPSLYDTHRPIPRARGGTYTPNNTLIALPTAHLNHHGAHRDRPPDLEHLKALVEDRNHIMRLRIRVSNQLLAYRRRTDTPTPAMLDALRDGLASIVAVERACSKAVEQHLASIRDDHRIVGIMLGVPCIGPITAAYCMVYLDPHRADHASSYWRYAGLDRPAHQRYTAGQASGGCRPLRTALYLMADTQVKRRGPYREVYDRVKERLSTSDRPVKTWRAGDRGRPPREVPWRETQPGHRHGAAMRAVMKHFLADLWYVWRTIEGLPAGPCYAEAVLGGGHKTVDPRSRGWVF